MATSPHIESRRHRFTVDEFHRMGEAGIFDENDRVELLEGEIVEMTPIESRHVGCVMRIQKRLHDKVSDELRVSVQNPLQLGEHSEPDPDIVLLRGRSDDYLESLPRAQDALVVIEVAESSVESDREAKIPLYARAEIPAVWLVDPQEERLERYEEPSSGTYQTVDLAVDEPLSVPDASDVELNPADIFR